MSEETYDPMKPKNAGEEFIARSIAKQAASTSLPPASAAEGPSPTPLLSDPTLLSAALGRKIGRPTIKNTDSIRKVLVGIRTKNTIGGAAAFAGIGRRTFYRWKRDDAEFSELVEMAQSMQVEKLVRTMLSYAKNGKREGCDWRAIAWLLERSTGANRELCKFNPDVVTPEMLAAAISRAVSILIPFVPAGEIERVQVELAQVYKDLKPSESRGDDDGS